ncbi:MAG: hypothetical protein QOE70_4643 [Chthoniobacter sp.]|jgi:WD40 repeat protein|nr:hypothetical protein [Chthoniobacter sp.]
MVAQEPKLIARAGLLAIEAAGLHHSLDTDQALRAVLALLPNAHLSLPCREEVQDIAFSADGDLLLVADGDGVLRRWNLPKRQEESQIPLDEKTKVVGISRDFSQLALWRDRVLVVRWMKDGREVPLELKYDEDGPEEVTFNGSGRFCIVRTIGRSHIYDTTTGKVVKKGRWWAAFDQKGDLNTCADTADGVFVVHSKSGRVLAKLAGFARAAAEGAVEKDDDDQETGLHTASLSTNARFAAVWSGQQVRVYEVATQRLLGEITSDQEIIMAQVDDRGRFAVVRGEHGVQTRIWSLSPVKEFARFSDNSVREVRFSPDGSCFATIGQRGQSVRLWRTIGGEEMTTIKQKSDAATGFKSVALDPNGEFLVMAGTKDEAWLCAVKGGRQLVKLPHRGIQNVAISRRDERIVTAGGDDEIQVWRLLRTEGLITAASAPVALKEPGEISDLCLTEDGSRLTTSSDEVSRAVRIWNTADGAPMASVRDEFGAFQITCSADGRLIAFGNGTSRINLVSGEDPVIVRQINHEQRVSAVSLSADGRYLASAATRDFEYQARIWEVSTGQQVAAATHDRDVEQVLFSADGRALVTAAEDGTSRLWSLDFTPQGKLTGATEVARIRDAGAASMTADLRYLATADSGAVHVWRLQQEDLAAQVQARSLRNLSRSEWQLYLGEMPYRKICPDLPEVPEERPEKEEAPDEPK